MVMTEQNSSGGYCNIEEEHLCTFSQLFIALLTDSDMKRLLLEKWTLSQ